MVKVLVLPPVQADHKARLESIAGAEYVYCGDEGLTRELMAEADIIFGNPDPELMRYAKRLRLLQLFSAGTDGYIERLPAGCELTNTTGAFGLAISEHLLAMLLGLMKRMHQYRDNQHERAWRDMGNVNSVEGSVVLTVGLGDIGGEFARKCKLLGAYTIGVRRQDTDKPDYIDELYLSDKLDELIPRADVIALAMPGTAQTYKLMNRARIDLMKRGAILLNVGRGGAVDTEALADAVGSGRILCGIDVTDPEPLPEGHRLWGMENALITPHVSGYFHLKKTLDNMVEIACLNIAAMINGGQYKNIVDRSTGYRKVKK